VSSTKRQKMAISRSIVEAVRDLNPPGRFLEKDPNTGLYSDIGHRKAVEKTSQALRDGAASLRKQLSADLGDPDFLNAVFEDNNQGQGSTSDLAEKPSSTEKSGRAENAEGTNEEPMDTTNAALSGKKLFEKIKVVKKVRGLLDAMSYTCVDKVAHFFFRYICRPSTFLRRRATEELGPILP
jgi:hypothetical protein